MGGKRMIDIIIDEYVYINLSDSDINIEKKELPFVINKKEFLKLYLQILKEDIPENMHKLITLFYKEFPGLKNKPALTVFFNLYRQNKQKEYPFSKLELNNISTDDKVNYFLILK